VVTGERKAPAVKNGKLRKKKGKKKKGADRWGQCAVKGRERTAAGARVVKAERAKCWAGPRAVAGRCGKGAAGPSEQATEWAARCSCGQAVGTGRQSRPAREREKEKGLGWFGWAKMEEDEFFNVKSFSKSISSISQI